jgi:hypothetical protein
MDDEILSEVEDETNWLSNMPDLDVESLQSPGYHTPPEASLTFDVFLHPKIQPSKDLSRTSLVIL